MLSPSRLPRIVLFASIALVAPASALGQTEHPGPAALIRLSETLPPYDVSSIKVNNTGANSSSLTISDSSNTLSGTNVSVETLIEAAYDVRSDRIFALTGPVKDAHFDIQAKLLPKADGTPPKLTDQQLGAMLISLLADRFQLKAHLEMRTLPVYELVILHNDPKLKLSTEPATGTSINMNASNTDRVLETKSASMSDLAVALSNLVHRPVIDKTGLAGHADIRLKWTSDEAVDQGDGVLSIFTALQEQLGLKLVSSKGPVEVLVIDHIEMPTEN